MTTVTQNIQQKLSDSKAARWTAMAIVSFTMMCGYFITDVMAPLEAMLTTSVEEGGLGWTSAEYGFFSGAYGYINVFLLMLFFGGIILDKMGVRFTGVMSCIFMFVGAAIKWYAISHTFGDATVFGFPAQVALAAFGFAVFGMGAEITGITVSKVIVKWFTGHELALAMGLQVAMARIGTAAALACSLPIANAMGDISAPILFGAICLCIGLIAYIVYCVMDRKLDQSVQTTENAEKEEGFQMSDLKQIFTNKGFWLITILCLMFYAGVFPFLKFATKLMIYKYHVEPQLAGMIPAMLPFGTILLTPLFGSIYDRQLGSAYAIIFYIQNIGLSMVPVLIGWVIEKYSTIQTAEGVTYDYTLPMVIFAVFGFIAILIAMMLKKEDGIKNYGLEKSNIQK